MVCLAFFQVDFHDYDSRFFRQLSSLTMNDKGMDLILSIKAIMTSSLTRRTVWCTVQYGIQQRIRAYEALDHRTSLLITHGG